MLLVDVVFANSESGHLVVAVVVGLCMRLFSCCGILTMCERGHLVAAVVVGWRPLNLTARRGLIVEDKCVVLLHGILCCIIDNCGITT